MISAMSKLACQQPAFDRGRRGAISRREFGRRAKALVAGLALSRRQEPDPPAPAPVAVVVVNGHSRSAAVGSAIELLGPLALAGKEVLLKGSYNSADPFPASTHMDTLRALVKHLREHGAGRITLVERSGMGVTSEVWRDLGVPSGLRDLDVALVPLDTLEPSRWRSELLPGSHWKHGVEVPEFLTRETCVVQVCNLKTHRFGGVFSASLKNSVGLVAKWGRVNDSPYNYMEELHASRDQRFMIAELNQVYAPVLVVMDAWRVFVEGGPDSGLEAQPGAVLASADRVAIDAAGLALLRLYGGRPALGSAEIFEQEQIKRAAELGLGVKSAKDIRFVPGDEAARQLALQMSASLVEPVPPEKP
jgi:uncharacterized protein (DUF362 family)